MEVEKTSDSEEQQQQPSSSVTNVVPESFKEPKIKDEEMTVSSEIDNIIRSLVANEKVTFKSQQRGEAEPTENEKTQIAQTCFENSKVNFLMKFGKFLKSSQLTFFNQFTDNSEPNWEETKIVLEELKKVSSENDKKKSVEVRNRRYQAMLEMIQGDEYFTEVEMMKRNPLLYEQLVGQYLTDEERHERDKYVREVGTTFVKILMEGIERNNAELSRKMEQQKEDDQMEETDSSEEEEDPENECPRVTLKPETPSTSRWGEFEEEHMMVTKSKKSTPLVTAEERKLLKEEFITSMYESFLEGKDEDFDYNNIDHNSKYDNVSEIDQDAEEKYFDSEEPETVNIDDNISSEDELDMYMNALNEHPSVTELARTMNRL